MAGDAWTRAAHYIAAAPSHAWPARPGFSRNPLSSSSGENKKPASATKLKRGLMGIFSQERLPASPAQRATTRATRNHMRATTHAPTIDAPGRAVNGRRALATRTSRPTAIHSSSASISPAPGALWHFRHPRSGKKIQTVHLGIENGIARRIHAHAGAVRIASDDSLGLRRLRQLRSRVQPRRLPPAVGGRPSLPARRAEEKEPSLGATPAGATLPQNRGPEIPRQSSQGPLTPRGP